MLSQDWHSTSAIAQARLALLLTHLTDEQEKQSGEGGMEATESDAKAGPVTFRSPGGAGH